MGARRAHQVLRIGLAFAFLYPPYAALLDPQSWFGYFPRFIRELPINSLVLLHGFGVIEVLLALWILSGCRIRLPAALAGLILLAIVFFNSGTFDVVFRDLSIAAIALALALWPEAAPSAVAARNAS
jgi:uncharacterized membrane protein YphA (DoxX/SURF4 family)